MLIRNDKREAREEIRERKPQLRILMYRKRRKRQGVKEQSTEIHSGQFHVSNTSRGPCNAPVIINIKRKQE